MTTATTSRPADGSHMPLVHLNGSGRQRLLDQLEATYRALSTAYDLLCDGAPHGRDYYPLGDDAYTRARAEFDRRRTVLQTLRDDVIEDWNDLQPYVTDRLNGRA